LPPARISPSSLTSVALAVATILVTVVALTGCGSSGSSAANADPATDVPASVPLYAGALVQPSGSLKLDALSTARRLTHLSNPYGSLVQALRGPGSSQLNFDKDVKPWLGNRAGVFITAIGASTAIPGPLLGPFAGLFEQALTNGSATASAVTFGARGIQGAIVLDSTDVTKARTFLYAEAAHDRAHASSYRGVSYRVAADGAAWGIVGHFAVLGSQSGLQSVIDTQQGAASLAHAPGYAKLLSSAPPGALANLYTSPGALFNTLGAAGGTGARALPLLLRLLAGTRQLDLSLLPSRNSLTLDANLLSSGPSGASETLGASGAQALAGLPANSWLAVGLGNLGSTLEGDPQDLHGLLSLASSALKRSAPEGSGSGSSTLDGATVQGMLGGLLAPLSSLSATDLRRDFLSWMGSAGVFASGSGLLDLKVGLVIDSKNAALSNAAVSKLAALIRKQGGTVAPLSFPGADAALSAKLEGLPVTLDVVSGRGADGQSKFVIGLTEPSVEEALHPSSTLSSSPSRSAASHALGEGIQPSLLLSLPELVSIFETVGLNNDPTISKVFPYLQALTTLDGGGKHLPAIQRYRIVLGL
jgi:hypothetical protein